MQEETFPFRLDERSRSTVSSLIAAMSQHKFHFQGTVGRIQILFLDKDQGVPIDTPVNFSADGIALHYTLNAIAKYNPPCRTWLQKFHQFLTAGRGKGGNLTPVPDRCFVLVEARLDGQLRYYLTYMTAHDDGSLAQDMPQGKLYATEPLFMAAPVAQPASPPPAKEQEPAGWLDD